VKADINRRTMVKKKINLSRIDSRENNACILSSKA
jgi:hypothetical protein